MWLSPRRSRGVEPGSEKCGRRSGNTLMVTADKPPPPLRIRKPYASIPLTQVVEVVCMLMGFDHFDQRFDLKPEDLHILFEWHGAV